MPWTAFWLTSEFQGRFLKIPLNWEKTLLASAGLKIDLRENLLEHIRNDFFEVLANVFFSFLATTPGAEVEGEHPNQLVENRSPIRTLVNPILEDENLLSVTTQRRFPSA